MENIFVIDQIKASLYFSDIQKRELIKKIHRISKLGKIENFRRGSNLIGCFPWEQTKEGLVFWYNIHRILNGQESSFNTESN
jgi:hypothetical protein